MREDGRWDWGVEGGAVRGGWIPEWHILLS